MMLEGSCTKRMDYAVAVLEGKAMQDHLDQTVERPLQRVVCSRVP